MEYNTTNGDKFHHNLLNNRDFYYFYLEAGQPVP